MRLAKVIVVLAVFAWVLPSQIRAQESFKRAEDLLKKIEDTRGEIKGASEQLGRTMTALTALSVAKGPGLHSAFGDFDKALSSLESKSGDVRKRATEMRAKGKDYFVAWQKEAAAIQNPDLRKASEARRVALMASNETLTTTMGEGRKAFVGLLGDLQDLRTFIGADLTDTTVASAREMITSAQAGAKGVEKTVAGIQAQLTGILSRK